jgi:hypothetical protein
VLLRFDDAAAALFAADILATVHITQIRVGTCRASKVRSPRPATSAVDTLATRAAVRRLLAGLQPAAGLVQHQVPWAGAGSRQAAASFCVGAGFSSPRGDRAAPQPDCARIPPRYRV